MTTIPVFRPGIGVYIPRKNIFMNIYLWIYYVLFCTSQGSPAIEGLLLNDFRRNIFIFLSMILRDFASIFYMNEDAGSGGKNAPPGNISLLFCSTTKLPIYYIPFKMHLYALSQCCTMHFLKANPRKSIGIWIFKFWEFFCGAYLR